MANLLESLAMGLKSAGGTLNPQVYAGNEQEYQNTIQNNRAQENAVRNMVLQAQMQAQMKQADPQYQAQLEAMKVKQRQDAVSQRIIQDPQVQQLLSDPTPQNLKRVGALFIQNGLPIPAHIKDLEPKVQFAPAGSTPMIDGVAQPTVPDKPKQPTPQAPGTLRHFQQGTTTITEELQPDGTWKQKASGPLPKTIVNVGDSGTVPTDDTLKMDAWRYLTDGTLPPNMGRGVQGTAQATKIRNEASALAKDMGMTPDEIRMAQLTNKTGIQAIGQLAKARAQILQFEKTAEANLDLAVKASEKVDRTGIPVFNKWLQAGRTAIAGDPDTAVFNAANETFTSEYARVMSGGYGAAQTTEGAQARAHTLLSTANTKEQYRRVTDQLKLEMSNRVKALNDQMAEERSRVMGSVNPKRNSSPSASGVDANNPLLK